MAKMDLESIEEALIQIVKTNLPAKLTEIDTEKNDGLILPTIDNAHYYDSFGDMVLNINNFIYYGYDTVGTPNGIGVATQMEFTFFVLVFFSHQNEIGVNRKIVFRYTRAMQEIFEANQKKVNALSLLRVTAAIPEDFEAMENSPIYKAGGIVLNGSITS